MFTSPTAITIPFHGPVMGVLLRESLTRARLVNRLGKCGTVRLTVVFCTYTGSAWAYSVVIASLDSRFPTRSPYEWWLVSTR